jgi:hypothetical protein
MLQRWYGNTEGYHKSSSCVLKAKRKIKELSLSKVSKSIRIQIDLCSIRTQIDMDA